MILWYRLTHMFPVGDPACLSPLGHLNCFLLSPTGTIGGTKVYILKSYHRVNRMQKNTDHKPTSATENVTMERMMNSRSRGQRDSTAGDWPTWVWSPTPDMIPASQKWHKWARSKPWTPLLLGVNFHTPVKKNGASVRDLRLGPISLQPTPDLKKFQYAMFQGLSCTKVQEHIPSLVTI